MHLFLYQSAGALQLSILKKQNWPFIKAVRNNRKM